MQMDVGLDTGDMLYKLSTPITERDNAQSLHDRLASLGAQAITEALTGLLAGTLVAEKQDESLACYAKKLHKAEAEIDWQQPAQQLARQVAAFNPWPVAQTLYKGEVLRIWEASVVDEVSGKAPGSVIRAGREGIDVACGEGVLRLRQLQRPGGKPQDAQAFLNANSVEGLTLGR
jgi:methionyl-tRNA formyltransferase